MLRFEEAIYLYKLEAYFDGRILEINTSKGYATVDTKKMYFYPHMRATIPSYCVKKGEDIYLMKEEPIFYA